MIKLSFFNMFLWLPMLGMLMSGCSRKYSSEKMITLSGQLMKIGQYCGGAPPSPELLEEIKAPKPLSNYELWIKKGKENNLDEEVFESLRTDSNGAFSIELPKGEYVLLIKEQLDRKIFEKNPYIQVMDRDALDLWWKKGLISFKADTQFEYSFREKCSLPLGVPHLRYTGPLAP